MKERDKKVRLLAIYVVLLAVLGGTASAAMVFADKVDYRTGRSPHGIYAADFDGDGDLDVVTANSDSSTFAYFANRGNGTFLEKVDYKTGEAPQGIYAADFDGDGDMDVVTADSGGLWTGNFSYFANNGNGTFSAKVNYKAGWSPHGIHAADFDGDGDPDVVVTNFLSHTFSYFTNCGDGTFLDKVDYGTGEVPKDIHAADFDGDGDMDVVTVGRGDPLDVGSFFYFANTGDGTFSAKEDYDIGQGTTDSIYSTDFDGDGDEDIVTTISKGFSYFENCGDGVFSGGTYYTPYYGTSTSIYAADFDNDGDDDIVTTHYLFHEEGYFSCFANTGDGSFSDPVDRATGDGPSGIYAADFDGDGDIDVITVNSDANTFSYFENVVSVVLVSDYTTNPPDIDGVIRPEEWTNKMPITLNGYEDPKSRKEGELYVMNDDDNIYIAVVIPDGDATEYDYLLLGFDNENDHISTDGDEDAIHYVTIDQTASYIDMYWDFAGEWWRTDVNQHGSGGRSYIYPHPGVHGKYRYEFVKPLKSGDTQDMALNPGDAIGFRIEACDHDETPKPHRDWYRYPQNTVDADTSRWDEWADLIIAVPDGGDKLMEGDADGDGCVSLKDSTAIKQYLVGKRDLNESRRRCADTNDDSEVTMKDSTLIRKWLVDPGTPLWQSPADDGMAKPETC